MINHWFSEKIVFCLFFVSFLFTGCAKGGGEEDGGDVEDVTGDEVTTLDGEDLLGDESIEELNVEVADVVADDGAAQCMGDEVIRFQFSDYDGNPVEGVDVAISCGGGEQWEATSDSSGIVEFSNLNLSAHYDLTYIYENRARSIVSLGGGRTIPEPFPITVGSAPEEDTIRMTGDVVHNEDGSWVVVTTNYGYDVTNQDRYSLRVPVGTSIPMSIFEYTSVSSVATPVGYSLITFDTPPAGEDGPVASAQVDADFESVSVMLNFDFASTSPLINRQVSTDEGLSPNRAYTGIRLWGADSNDMGYLVGMTTNWSKGEATDLLAFSWATSGYAASDKIYASVLIIDQDFLSYVTIHLPDDPSVWSEFDVHDVPPFGSFTPLDIIPFDTDIPVIYPEWASTISFHIRLSSGGGGVIAARDFQWVVVTHPETSSFNFASLPFPSSHEYSDVLPHGVTLFVGVVGVEYDEDPFAGYILWTDEEWSSLHYKSAGVDSRFRIQPP